MSESREAPTYNEIKAAFVAKGDTLTAWCRRNGITLIYAIHCLKGICPGPKGRALAERVRRAAMSPREKA